MSIQLIADIRRAGSVVPAGTSLSLSVAEEALLVSEQKAVFVSTAPTNREREKRERYYAGYPDPRRPAVVRPALLLPGVTAGVFAIAPGADAMLVGAGSTNSSAGLSMSAMANSTTVQGATDAVNMRVGVLARPVGPVEATSGANACGLVIERTWS